MSQKLVEAIDKSFEKNRIIFWYDDDGSQANVFHQYTNPAVEKLEIQNNEFWIKYHILKENPKGKVLIYSKTPKPADSTNWLLDVNYENFVFATDDATVCLQDLGLPEKHFPFIETHIDFFREREDSLESIKSQLTDHGTDRSLAYAMISALCRESSTTPVIRKDLKSLLIPILGQTFAETQVLYDATERYNLEDFFWEEVKKTFEFESDEPSLKGLIYYLFSKAFSFMTGKSNTPSDREAFTFLDGWRNTIEYIEGFKNIANTVESELNIEHEIESLDINSLTAVDLYKIIDAKILRFLTDRAMHGTIENEKALSVIRARREKFWYVTDSEGKTRDYYLSLEAFYTYYLKAYDFNKLPNDSLSIWSRYVEDLYELDMYHRMFLFNYLGTAADSNFYTLLEKLEKHYLNSFSYTLQQKWESSLKEESASRIEGIQYQNDFFKKTITPYLTGDKVVFVIISDALRYECGVVLCNRLQQRNRFQVDLDPMFASTPTYTARGMASLLPHEAISFEKENNSVSVDGQKLSTIAFREMILQNYLDAHHQGKKAGAMQSQEFIGLSLQEQEKAIEGIDLFYFYSNTIDSTGDNAKSENALAKAVDDEISFLQELCKKITNLNRTHIVITSDHGFLYQYSGVQEQECISVEKLDREYVRTRRFIIGKDLPEVPGLSRLQGNDVELDGDIDVLIAQGLSRIKLPGAGLKYVHGGISLQELCVPVLKIRKGRHDDIQTADVEVIKKSDVITSGNVTITFYQRSPVGAKIHPRVLLIRFESPEGIVISNSVDAIFDNPQNIDENRTKSYEFSFTKEAGRYNNKQIFLKLYNKKEGGNLSHYAEYSYRYKIYVEKDFDL